MKKTKKIIRTVVSILGLCLLLFCSWRVIKSPKVQSLPAVQSFRSYVDDVIRDLKISIENFTSDFKQDYESTHDGNHQSNASEPAAATTYTVSWADIPEYDNSPYVLINNNEPFFTDEDFTTYTVSGYEYYTPLDWYKRCGPTIAYVGLETMPTEKRGDISSIKPSGWKNKNYSFVDGEWVYNRCHLIGWQLTAENANKENLITGTRYMNVEGMLPFENMVADYVKETNNHVLYRVTPIFNDKELVARGVLMEAYSYEDHGSGVEYCVFCYNVQPGITIDYSNGNNWLSSEQS